MSTAEKTTLCFFASLYGLALVWSPMFGTSESLLFPSLAALPSALLFSRIGNLVGFALVMALMSFFGERIRKAGANRVLLVASIILGVAGMLAGSLVGCGVLDVVWLPGAALMRGLFYGALTVQWIGALIHLEGGLIGSAVCASLVVYAAVSLALLGAASVSPWAATALLGACPVVTSFGCILVRGRVETTSPIDQESTKAPFHTRCLLYGANFLFGLMLGALLYYFALFHTPVTTVVFLVMAAVLLAVFIHIGKALSASVVFRTFMLAFAVIAAAVLLCGFLNELMAAWVASAVLAFITLYTIVIFIDTQARLRKPYWKIPGMCQVFAAAGMIVAAVLFQAVLLDASDNAYYMAFLATLCIVFVAGVFSPSDYAGVRPWGFSSLIPHETPEERKQRRCSELAEESGLTCRELEILHLLADGMSKDEIASALVISPTTAKTHIRNIYAKLGVHSQKELIARMDK